MKQNRSLDLAKFVCAILIVIIHADPFGDYSKILSYGFRNIICTVAVPFFFISSGYIFISKINSLPTNEEKWQYYKKYILRLIKMYLCWSAVYFVFVLIKWNRAGFSVALVLEYVRDFFFEGSYSTIWFLPALISAASIVFFLSRKLSYPKVFVAAIPFYMFALLGSAYRYLAETVSILDKALSLYYSFFDTIKNGVLMGFIYVAIGGVFASGKLDFKMSKTKNIVLIAVFFVLLAIEEIGISYMRWSFGCDNAIMLVPLSILIFKFVLNTNLKENDIYLKLRKYSLLMFLCQRIPISVIEMFMGDTILYTNSALFFVVVLGSTLIISWGIIKLTGKVRVLKYFY